MRVPVARSCGRRWPKHCRLNRRRLRLRQASHRGIDLFRLCPHVSRCRGMRQFAKPRGRQRRPRRPPSRSRIPAKRRRPVRPGCANTVWPWRWRPFGCAETNRRCRGRWAGCDARRSICAWRRQGRRLGSKWRAAVATPLSIRRRYASSGGQRGRRPCLTHCAEGGLACVWCWRRAASVKASSGVGRGCGAVDCSGWVRTPVTARHQALLMRKSRRLALPGQR